MLKFLTFLFLFTTNLLTTTSQPPIASPDTSVCALSGGVYNSGVGVCGTSGSGEIMLRSNLIEVGIHAYGSYGTTRVAAPGYVVRNDARLGFIADHGNDGWTTGLPPYSGDYFVPGSPVEGWVIEWRDTQNRRRINKGLSNPGSNNIGATHMVITSQNDQQSALWVGSSGDMQVTKITQFDENKLYFTTSVTLKNLGLNSMTDVYYMRTVDPDQEQPHTLNYSTNNYVKWQRFIDGDSVNRANGVGDLRNECFVGAEGQLYSDLFCGLGTINSHCRANHFGFNNNRIGRGRNNAWGNSDWEADSEADKNSADEAINLMFKYDVITSGATVQFNYAYVLAEADLVEAMNSLQAVTITQPTDIVSGTAVLMEAEITEEALNIDPTTNVAGNPVSEVTFKIFASLLADTEPSWITVAVIPGAPYDPADPSSRLYSTFVLNSRDYRDSVGQLKAIFEMSDNTFYENSIGIEIFEGIDMCFDLDNDGVSDGKIIEDCELKMGATNRVSLVPCVGEEGRASTIDFVSFFRTITVGGEVSEQLIMRDSTPTGAAVYSPEEVNVDDLFAFMEIAITAKTTLNLSGNTVSSSVKCRVLEQNYAPFDIDLVLSGPINEVVGTPGGSWITVGSLTTEDANEFDTHTYSLGGTDGGMFRITGTSLEHSPALDFESLFPGVSATTATRTITITSDDGKDDLCCFSKPFDLVINNVNEKPTFISTKGVAVDADTVAPFDIDEDMSLDSVIHDFIITDPDVGQTHQCTLVGASSQFEVDFNTCQLRLKNRVDFEAAVTHSFTLIVSDVGGVPIAQEGFQILVNVGDVNESPTNSRILPAAGIVCTGNKNCEFDETTATGGTAVGTTIGYLEARDPECGPTMQSSGACPAPYAAESLSFAITGNPGNYFAIRNGVNGDELYIANAIDFEGLETGTITIFIRATDSVGLSYTGSFSFFIADVDEPPSADNLNCFLDEGTGISQIAGNTLANGFGDICIVQATASGDEELAYSIITPGEDNFSIQDCSGIIFVAKALDYEAGPTSHTFQVQIDGSGTSSSTVTVTIAVLDINEPPTFTSPTILLNIEESEAANTVVLATLTDQVVDEDAVDTTRFVLFGGNVDNTFDMDSATGAITLLRPIDFESTNSYSLQVSVQDSGNLYAYATIEVTVLDSPENPVFPAYTGTWAQVFEKGATGGANDDDLVGGFIIASDEDTLSTVTYSIQAGNVGGAFKISDTIVTEFGARTVGQLAVNDVSVLDFEDAGNRNYALTVRATDDTFLTVDVTLNIQIMDSNEAPVLSPQVFSINEDAAQGSLVGTSLSELTTDPETDVLAYNKVNGDTGIFTAFAIDSDSGNLTVATGRLSFEQVSQYIYNIAVSDGRGGRIERSVTVNVLDVAEAPQFSSVPDGSIDENAGANAYSQNSDQLVRIVVEDEDTGDTVTLAIASTEPARPGLFALEVASADQYYLKALSDLNFEAVSAYVINLEATDGTGLITTSSVTVNVNNLNDPPTLGDGVNACFIDVLASPNTQACAITAQDEDSSASVNGQLTYTMTYSSCFLSSGGGATGGGSVCDGNGYMTLGLNNGLMETTALSFPNESGNPANNWENALLTYIVTVEDGGGLSATATYTLAVRPTNNLPVCGSSADLTFSLDENSLASISVGTLTGPTLIRDSENDLLSLSITAGNSGGFFTISADNTALITTATSVNYEVTPVFTLNVRVTESATAEGNTVDCVVTVAIVDLNEPTVFDAVTLFADENIASGALTNGGFAVDSIAAFDVDARDQGGTYQFVAPLPSPSPLEIISATGVLHLKAGMTLDFEVVSSYTYNVRWTSPGTWGGAPNENQDAILTLQVTDIPEPPVIAVNGGGAGVIFAVNEGVAGSLGFLSATDPDFPSIIPCDDNCGLRYTLSSTDGGPFAIDRNTGELSVTTDTTDFEAKGVYSLISRVQDQNGIGAVDNEVVQVWINNVNDCTVSAIWDDLSGLTTSLFKTQGLQKVNIYGNNLIPTAARLAEAGMTDASVVIAVVFKDVSPTPRSYTPTGCVLVRAAGLVGEHIACFTVEGTGGPFAAEVTVTVPYPANAGGAGSGGTKTCTTPLNFGAVMNYRSPVISAITVDATFTTAGGTIATFDGENFGPLGTAVFAAYSNGDYSYTTAQCTIETAHLQVRCATVAGVGAGHQWRLQVAGLFSTVYPSLLSSYITPQVTGVALKRRDDNTDVLNADMDTSGTDDIYITGSNFGNGLAPLTVQYGTVAQFSNGLAYTATGCVVINNAAESCTGHTCAKCSAVAGVGQLLAYRVSVGGQTGPSSTVTTSYHIPIITRVWGPGFFRASSEGGQVINIAGSQFGPAQASGDYGYIEVTYGPGFIYTATDCAIVTAHQYVRCFTGPGTGFDHAWKITISSVESVPFATAMSYAPPIVAFYSGPAADDGDTRGNQVITVLGRNFGTVLAKVTSVTYSKEQSDRIFDVTASCVITIEHTTLSCLTAPGAGTEMLWNVTVDGQQSEAPTTGYAPPIITSLSGPGVNNAVNFGAQTVTITGNYFGPSNADSIAAGYTGDFIDGDGVSYGPTGSEYIAQGCGVIDQTTIECQTAPGVGRDLFWSVSVAGQQSDLDVTVVSNYAPPVISGISPSVYSTEGNIQVVIDGTNLGVVDVPIVSFGALTLPRADVTVGNGVDKVFFTLPEKNTLGTGHDHAITLEVGGQVSNSVTFTYEPPVISSVHSITDLTDPLKVTVILLGKSFSTIPNVFLKTLTNVDVELFCFLQTHTEIQCYTTVFIGTITVVVDGLVSNEIHFESGDPVVVYARLEENNGDLRYTAGGGVLEILCQYCGLLASELEVNVGREIMRGCVIDASRFTQASFNDNEVLFGALQAKIQAKDATIEYNEGEYVQQIFCTLPEGQDINQSVTVTRSASTTSLGCASDDCVSCTTAPCFSYLPPQIETVSSLTDNTRGGKAITITGRSFGITMDVMYGSYQLAITSSSHTEVTGTVPPGVDFDMPMYVQTGSQRSTEEYLFSYERPTFSVPSIQALSSKTSGKPAATITGDNFGDSSVIVYDGPILTIGGVNIPVLTFDDDEITFAIPPGSGFDLPITLNVSDLFNSVGETFSYDPPQLSTTSLTTPVADTVGGRISGETVTLIGDNFGLEDGDWTIVLVGDSSANDARRRVLSDDIVITEIDLVVNRTDIVSWTHTQIEFYAPEGQGINKALVVYVGGQLLEPAPFAGILCGSQQNAVACFNYNPPVVSGLGDIDDEDRDTNGGYILEIVGTSFGVSGATVSIGDNQYDNEDEINRQRMPPTPCPVVTQDHALITCTVPPGYGGTLEVRVTVEGITAISPAIFRYARPVINFVIGNQGGDAAGGEVIKVYGDNLGSVRTPVNLTIGNDTCVDAYWTNDDPVFDNKPYINCLSSASTFVGQKVVTLDVAFSNSDNFTQWSVECKVGYYGKVGEECAECGDPEITGYICDSDNLQNPISSVAWWNIEQVVPSIHCHPEMNTGTRETCPSMWPCMPTFACLGNNTCSFNYDGESVRCSQCNEGYFKLGGLCQECPDNPWIIIIGLFLFFATAFYVGKKIEKKQVNLGILTIGVDYFQVLAIFSSANVEWPSELQNLYNVLSAFNLNIDLAAPECWQGSDFTYDQKWVVVELTPITLLALAGLAYAIKYSWKRMKGRKARLHSHAPKLFGTTVTIFYYTYLYVTTKTLSVFNCQATVPDDGYTYMTEVGTEDGRCYVDGGMQRRLEPWAYITFAMYTLGFPVFCGVLLYTNRMTCFLDQVLKADRRNEEELKAAGVYQFRKMWHRLYHYYKPQYFYWILIVLLRKFMIAFTALVFRDNTLFMLSMTLLIMILSYAVQVKYQPYMSTAEFDKVVDDNSAMIDEIVSAKLAHLKLNKTRSNRTKVAKLGHNQVTGYIAFQAPTISFLHNYNTVESSLLFSAIIVNLSGIMYESNQLTGFYEKGLTYFIITLVLSTLFYFVWVLSTELWVAFYPLEPFLWLKCCSLSRTEEDEGEGKDRDSDVVFDINPGMVMGGDHIDTGITIEKMQYLEGELNKMWGKNSEMDRLVKSLQEENRVLKQAGATSRFQSLGKSVVNMKKEKKEFITSAKELSGAAVQAMGFNKGKGGGEDRRQPLSPPLPPASYEYNGPGQGAGEGVGTFASNGEGERLTFDANPMHRKGRGE